MIIKRELTKRMLAAFSAICLMMGTTPGITAMAAQEPVSETESFDINAAEEMVEVISEDAGQPAEAVSDAEEATDGADEGLAEDIAAVQPDGTLRIHKAGKTKLKAKINGKTINITVKVE